MIDPRIARAAVKADRVPTDIVTALIGLIREARITNPEGN